MPLTLTVANLNMDGGNLLGRVKELNVLGDTKSTLGPQLSTFLQPRGRSEERRVGKECA